MTWQPACYKKLQLENRLLFAVALGRSSFYCNVIDRTALFVLDNNILVAPIVLILVRRLMRLCISHDL